MSLAKPNVRTLEILKRVVSENFRDHIPGYSFAIACLAAVALSTAYTAYAMKGIVDEAFVSKDARLVWLICFSLFAAFVIRGFASYGQAVALSRVSNSIVARYQKRLAAHLMTLPLEFFDERRSGQVAALLSQNISGIRDVLNLTVTSTARDMLSFVSLLAVMVYQDPLLSIVVLLMAPALLFGLRFFSRRLKEVALKGIRLNGIFFGTMQETIQGISVVKAFTMERALEARVEDVIVAVENRSNQLARLSERNAPVTESFAGLMLAGILAYAAYRSIYFNVPPGAFFSFVTALLLLYDPLRRLAKLQVQMERAAVHARMIYELLDMEPRQRDLPDAKPLRPTEARIEFRDVSFAYGTETVLNGVSFVAEGGKTTALVGPSGAGKSTIMNLIPRFYDPKGGEILIDGQDIAHVTKQSLREQLAYVSQQPYLFEGSIRNNIRYGRPDATDAEVEEAARLAYAHEFILAQPNGYDTPVGENGVTLSGGQRQRLSIARALVRNAPILLLDEATSALDTESEAAVQKALDQAMTGRTVVVIAHRLSTVVRADKIVVMQQGRVVEEGDHEALAKLDDGLYARLSQLGFNA
ncbi:ATP-binding cassette subfamily B protein [Rhizobium azibense]|uniref:ATP-binding cassette subfamily B protein n=1 Tax=Rhizobium azibense TaxID=1136135 RepID=A0A4R3QJF1_9HYPH|nr:ABC transporter ATP-binding protein [Rhizobium azibense]TCU21214.1 ATP-binding cassette subfamily B protein [Rhizobium azibense]